MVVDKDVFVTARDGVRLAVDIYRPDAPGKFPALLAISPVRQRRADVRLPAAALRQVGLRGLHRVRATPATTPQRGYVYVIADLRGIGYSEGEYEGLFSRHEGEDGADIVEWLAQQPWCDGNVGGAGICYFASMQLHIAAEQPPHLKCIAPWEIFGDDLYNHGQYEGGVFNIFLYGLYTGTYPARCGYAINERTSRRWIRTRPRKSWPSWWRKRWPIPT